LHLSAWTVPFAEHVAAVILQVDADRTLPGWGSSLKTSSSSRSVHDAPDAATDALVLTYEVPWPVNLLVGEQQLQQYAAVFSVLLRLRRLQQQLTNQWAAINSRPGGSSSSKLHVSSSGLAPTKAGSRSSSSSRRIVVSRRQSQQEDEDVAAAADTLRLQQLRRWHAMALHCVSSVLGGMLSELSGHLWVDFETAVSAQPVSLPAIIAAHDELLVAAQKVCLLPLQQQQQVVGNSSSSIGMPAAAAAGRKTSAAEAGSDANSRGSAMHGQLAGTVYRLVAAAWQLQQQVQQLLPHMHTFTTNSSSCVAACAGAFREGSSAGSLAVLLQQDEQAWEGCAVAGATLEGLLLILRKLLAVDRAGEVGHSMAGLAARLGLYL
jgi:hypothetical protein